MLETNVFVDCGAPSLYNQLSRKEAKKGIMGASFKERKYDDFSYTEKPEYKKYLEDYISFLSENKKKIQVYSNLDVINNAKLTYQNQKLIESAGLSPIPVFHLGEDPKWLLKYIGKYEYIALGGLVPNPTSVLIPILDRVFKDYILDSNGIPKIKVHGFACTSLPLMLRYPWYSVDSATCRKLGMYGGIAVPRADNKKMVTVNVSSRDVPLKYKVPAQILRSISSRSERYGISVDELAAESTQRTIWNYLIYKELLAKAIPQWPWSMTTRISEKKATRPMDFYFAGSLSKKDEAWLWDSVGKANIPIEERRRLVSFFYKGEARHILSEVEKTNKTKK